MATSTWDWPVSKRNSANSTAHSGRFFGLNSGNSSWMLAWAIGLSIFQPLELGLKGEEIRLQGVPELTALFSQSQSQARSAIQQLGLSEREDEKGWGK